MLNHQQEAVIYFNYWFNDITLKPPPNNDGGFRCITIDGSNDRFYLGLLVRLNSTLLWLLPADGYYLANTHKKTFQ